MIALSLINPYERMNTRMDETTNSPLNSDNLLSVISRVWATKEVSKRTNNPYYQIHIAFGDTYTFEAFLTKEQLALIGLAQERRKKADVDSII